MSAKVIHTHPVIFGRREPGCPRCAELSAGAPVRKGWGAAKRAFEAAHIAEVRAHDCRAAKCGPVCTFGDW